MNVEIGIMNVDRPVSFDTDASAENVSKKITATNIHGGMVELEDSKGRTIIIPAHSIGYVIIGSETTHPVGFGALS